MNSNIFVFVRLATSYTDVFYTYKQKHLLISQWGNISSTNKEWHTAVPYFFNNYLYAVHSIFLAFINGITKLGLEVWGMWQSQFNMSTGRIILVILVCICKWQDLKEVGRYQGQPIWDQKVDFATFEMLHWACYWRQLHHCLTFPHTRSHPTHILSWLQAGIPLGAVLSLQFSSLSMHIGPVIDVSLSMNA